MMIFYTFMLAVSILILTSSHPVMILIYILTQTLLICLTIWINLNTSWFSFILFLIFLGGLMVLFVYIVSLASNEKFETNFNSSTKISLFLIILLNLILSASFFEKMNNFSVVNFYKTTSLIFFDMMIMPTAMIMFYLFYTLVVAVKISSKFEGPLRNFIN